MEEGGGVLSFRGLVVKGFGFVECVQVSLGITKDWWCSVADWLGGASDLLSAAKDSFGQG